MNTQTYCNFYVGATKHLEPDKKLSQGLCVLLLKIKQASLKWSHGAKELRGVCGILTSCQALAVQRCYIWSPKQFHGHHQ